MAAQSHGAKRLGAERPKVADVQLTARVSSAASKAIKAHGLDGGIAAGVRHMADFRSSHSTTPARQRGFGLFSAIGRKHGEGRR